ncbi:KRAB domain-containing protein 4 isoform X7 [Pongo abelii]|uniref:KRAB domain-containing protein 4 isoform X7 n=1 Tax=Pongo abelii TaxID=9601 RepID=UPI0023E8B805|nr:KRAB domain-containing protein 4 isoform X7 [Pongo abelii]
MVTRFCPQTEHYQKHRVLGSRHLGHWRWRTHSRATARARRCDTLRPHPAFPGGGGKRKCSADPGGRSLVHTGCCHRPLRFQALGGEGQRADLRPLLTDSRLQFICAPASSLSLRRLRLRPQKEISILCPEQNRMAMSQAIKDEKAPSSFCEAT